MSQITYNRWKIFIYTIVSVITIFSICSLLGLIIINNIGLLIVAFIGLIFYGLYLKSRTKYEIIGYVIICTSLAFLILTISYLVYWIMYKVRC